MNPVYNAFVYLVWFFATYYLVLITLILLAKKEELYERPAPLKGRKPRVSLLVPAYNEEEHIQYTINSLKGVSYPNVEFIFINDGSTDRTAQIIRTGIKGDSRFRFIDNKKNKGKARCLNQGVSEANGKYVACMDADSMIEPSIFEKVLPYFRDSRVGSVTVSVEVANKKKFINKIFDLEFIIGLSLFLKVFSFFNCVFVTPGPFSIYRKKAMIEIGGFNPDIITEDLEIAYRLHKHGYTIENCLDAKVCAFMPETFKGAYVQRRRWYSGAIQTLWLHKNMLFSSRFGLFGFFVSYNYLLISTGMIVFFLTTYLTLKNWLTTAWSMQYTGFNFFDRLLDVQIDFLRVGQVSLLGYTALMMSVVLMFLGLVFTHKRMREKKLGMLGYPLLFFLYQIFWIGAIIAVLRRRKISWR